LDAVYLSTGGIADGQGRHGVYADDIAGHRAPVAHVVPRPHVVGCGGRVGPGPGLGVADGCVGPDGGRGVAKGGVVALQPALAVAHRAPGEGHRAVLVPGVPAVDEGVRGRGRRGRVPPHGEAGLGRAARPIIDPHRVGPADGVCQVKGQPRRGEKGERRESLSCASRLSFLSWFTSCPTACPVASRAATVEPR
jgi:hypothetical protein